MSRTRSTTARGASPAAGGRSAAGRPGIFVQTPKSDIFVALLGVALGAMVLGCLLLILVLQRYEFKTKASASLTPSASAVQLALSEKPVFSPTVHL